MRLSEWRKAAPARESMTAKVLGVVDPVIAALGADRDPYCWVIWGEDPQMRYSIYVPTRAGLATIAVRVEIPGEGPRANGKLVRWSRLQLSELTIEAQGGHRLIAMQVEGQVLRGMDAQADAIAEFVRGLIAAMDGREWMPPEAAASSAPRPSAARESATARSAASPAGTRGASDAAPKPRRPKETARPKGASRAPGKSAGAERTPYPALGPGTSAPPAGSADNVRSGRARRDG